ncbi:PDZ domain-containing protein [Fundidesulfovibrio magnetotacticus]|nr:PDZ domain-containing protein [Fundidesulfovibrio magnetotacticus]
MTDRESQEPRHNAADPREMQKAFLWAGALMFVCILAMLVILLKFTGVGAPGSKSGEDGTELRLAAQAAGQAQPAHQIITLPSGLGNQQMQLIDTPLPSGFGNQQMQLIAQSGVYLGLGLSDLQPTPGQQSPGGAYVTTVIPGSPGQKAGIEVGDVLLSIDRTALMTPADLGGILSGKRAGDVIKAVYSRNGVITSAHITLANVPLGASVGDPGDSVWLGADIQNIDAIIRIQFNLPDANGVIVSYVAPRSPAETAGLATGDVIKRIGETRISDVKQLSGIIAKSAPGQQLRMVVERGAKPMNVTVTLSRRPPPPAVVPMVAPPDITIEATWIGMGTAELTGKDVSALGLPPGTKGILVTDVEGRAMAAGFQSGDVILAVNNVPTPTMDAFVGAASQQAGAVAEILRAGKHMFLSVPPPGFTAQGTQLNAGTNQKFQQVAATRPAMVGVLVQHKTVDSAVGSEGVSNGLIIVDEARRTYAIVELKRDSMLPPLLQQLGVAALICADVTPQTANVLNSSRIAVYSGVSGTVLGAVNLYEQQGLVPYGGK